jgi:peptidoglycan/LPS O-acetylase OafA/YrhL
VDSPTAGHLRKEDTELLKGLGILMIALHNYFHFVAPSPGENEFRFDPGNVTRLLQMVARQPLETPNLLFDYFGHYGVQLFVFLSAYGLTRAYGGQGIRLAPFLLQRIARIYPTLVIAVAAYLLFAVTPWSPALAFQLKFSALTLSLLSGFVPGYQLSAVGPWWFFSFIFQFYLVFPLLDRLATRYGAPALAAVAVAGLVATIFANPFLYPLRFEAGLYGTVVGHLPVICLGIYMARADRLAVDRKLALAAAAVCVLGNRFEPLWYLMPVCVTLLFLVAMPGTLGWLRAQPLAHRFVGYCGAVSLPLFAVNGFMREPFVRAANEAASWYLTLALAVLFLAASLAAAQAVQWIERAGRRWFARHLATRA